MVANTCRNPNCQCNMDKTRVHTPRPQVDLFGPRPPRVVERDRLPYVQSFTGTTYQEALDKVLNHHGWPELTDDTKAVRVTVEIWTKE